MRRTPRKRSAYFNSMDRRSESRQTAEELELERQPTDDALWRPDNEELVVDRLVDRRLAEEIADGYQHFPLRAAEVHERQRLPHLDVEARIEGRGLRHIRLHRPRERVAHAVKDDDTRRGFGDFGLDCGRDIVNLSALGADRG